MRNRRHHARARSLFFSFLSLLLFGGCFGSAQRYAVPTGGGNVELSLAPDELDELGDRDALASRYEAQLEANAGAPGERGDSNDDDVARRKRKLERAGGAAGGSKKPRDFKF